MTEEIKKPILCGVVSARPYSFIHLKYPCKVDWRCTASKSVAVGVRESHTHLVDRIRTLPLMKQQKAALLDGTTCDISRAILSEILERAWEGTNVIYYEHHGDPVGQSQVFEAFSLGYLYMGSITGSQYVQELIVGTCETEPQYKYYCTTFQELGFSKTRSLETNAPSAAEAQRLSALISVQNARDPIRLSAMLELRHLPRPVVHIVTGYIGDADKYDGISAVALERFSYAVKEMCLAFAEEEPDDPMYPIPERDMYEVRCVIDFLRQQLEVLQSTAAFQILRSRDHQSFIGLFIRDLYNLLRRVTETPSLSGRIDSKAVEELLHQQACLIGMRSAWAEEFFRYTANWANKKHHENRQRKEFVHAISTMMFCLDETFCNIMKGMNIES